MEARTVAHREDGMQILLLRASIITRSANSAKGFRPKIDVAHSQLESKSGEARSSIGEAFRLDHAYAYAPQALHKAIDDGPRR